MKTALELAMQAIISAGWNIQSDGEVDSPTGHFAIVERPAHPGELNDMLAAIEDQEDPDNIHIIHAFEELNAGFYEVIEDSNGLVHINGPVSREQANTWFHATESAYSQWNVEDPSDV